MTKQWRFPSTPRHPHQLIDWHTLFNDYEWLDRMEGISQDPSNHGEIDLAIHVKAVAEALVADDSWLQLSESEQDILFFTALLHDVAKPDTRTVIDGKITFPHHAPKGTYMAREILWKTFSQMPIEIRETICSMVRYHGLPLKFLEKTEREIIKVSLSVNTKLLSLFSKADVLGRICADQEQLLETISLFELQCQELDCWDHPRSFVSPLARFLYFKEEKDLNYHPFDDTKGTVHLLAGLPGAGKDTYIQKYLSDFPVVSLDQIRQELQIDARAEQGRVIQFAKEKSRQYMRKGANFVWNATNITALIRSGLIDFFWQYRFQTHIHYLEVPYNQLLQQNIHRNAVVPEHIIEKLIHKLEPPTLHEASWISWNTKQVGIERLTSSES